MTKGDLYHSDRVRNVHRQVAYKVRLVFEKTFPWRAAVVNKKRFPMFIATMAIVALATLNVSAQVIVNHASTDLSSIPEEWISQAAANLHIAYNHTSHGSHLISGMNALKNYPEYGDSYRWSDNGADGLDLDDLGIPCPVPDLSQGDSIDQNGVTPWVTCTRSFLDNPSNSHINVVMWSWCSIEGHDAQRYVDNMEILIAEYPHVHFVFMTGHAQGQGEYAAPGTVHSNNELIREHCRIKRRVLFDFADIEAFDPDGEYYWDLDMWDNLDYTVGNWAVEWISENTGTELERLTTGTGVDGYNGVGYCAHSDAPAEASLNCVLKGRAAWWLFSELSGWNQEIIFEDGFESATLTAWETPDPTNAGDS